MKESSGTDYGLERFSATASFDTAVLQKKEQKKKKQSSGIWSNHSIYIYVYIESELIEKKEIGELYRTRWTTKEKEKKTLTEILPSIIHTRIDTITFRISPQLACSTDQKLYTIWDHKGNRIRLKKAKKENHYHGYPQQQQFDLYIRTNNDTDVERHH